MMDFYPTLANLTGADIPKDRIIDGEDIQHLILDDKKAQKPHKPLFYYRVNQLRAVRSGKWKLVLELDDKKTKIPQALYDLQTDISETTDLSASYPKVVERLLAMIEECRNDLGDTLTGRVGKNCRLPGRV
jgi:arylsulfatase A-like enzyme